MKKALGQDYLRAVAYTLILVGMKLIL